MTPRAGRAISHVLTGASLALLLAVAAAWPLSYRRAYLASLVVHGGKIQAIGLCRGRTIVFLSDIALAPGTGWSWDAMSAEADTVEGACATVSEGGEPEAHFHGFDLSLVSPQANSFLPRNSYVLLAAPDWFLLALLAVLPLRWAMRWRRCRLRAKRGLCVKCGYDLRSSPGRCPECGAAAAMAATPASADVPNPAVF
jgi:hypothetical protein